MGNLVLVEKISNLISEVDKYIKSNKDWVFYFLNPLAGTDGDNKPLFDCMKEHPEDWEKYIDFFIIDVSTTNIRISINIDDNSDFGIELKRYIFLPHFEESVLRNKKIYGGHYDEIRMKNLEDDINEPKSILEKKEAMKILKDFHDKSALFSVRTALDTVIPELKESKVSKDERIRKAVIAHIKDLRYYDTYYSITPDEMLAWLEKQGELPICNIPSREVILAIWDLGNEWKELTNGCISTEYGTQLNYIQNHWHESEYYLRAIQDEQKPADKVEPKFKVGDWVFIEEVKGYKQGAFQIKSIDEFGYNFDEYHIIPFMYEELLSKWTIQDEKDGDVLANDNSVFIYSKVLYNKPYAYCGIDKFGVFKDNCLKYDWSNSIDNIRPATREQRDLLFKKMKEAGYEWNAEKKELKKIERKHTGKVEPIVVKDFNSVFSREQIEEIDKRIEKSQRLYNAKLRDAMRKVEDFPMTD